MLTEEKTGLFTRLNEILEYAKQGDEFFAYEICNFITNEFNLQASVIFTIHEGNILQVLGKSDNAHKKYLKGTSFNCNACKLLSKKIAYTFDFDSNCGIQISDYLIYEGCALIKISDSLNLLIKIANKSLFSKVEKEGMENVFHFLESIFLIWHQNRNTRSASLTSFSELTAKTIQVLKGYINSIIGFITILNEENASSTHSEYISSIKRNAQSLLLNINDLNEISKAESKNLLNVINKIALNDLINEIIDLFKNKLKNQKILFISDVAPELTHPLAINDKKLKYIISTLMFVSIYLTEEGRITLSAKPQANNKIKFTIQSEGSSIPDDIRSKIFEPFALLHMKQFKNSSITGLSLTLIKKYVNFLGGEISVLNDSGKSLIFTFTINGEVMSELESTLSKLPKPTSKNKVLVIEDDYATSKLLSNYLKKWGYDPIIVSTEDQALNIIDNEHLLAVILDIELPNVNGLELLKNIHAHKNTKNVPVIVCSIEPEQQKAFMMGAVEYFVKPINYNYLVEVLTSYKLRKDSNILCVDDDVPALNLIKQAIESAGFNALAESISSNVLDLIKNKDIDLAIIDLDMPAPDGFELIKLIKSEKRFAHLPIMIYTGKENYKDDLYKIEGLFEELLDKRSTNIEDLADTINVMINRLEVPPPAEEVFSKKGGIKILLAEDYKHSQIIVTRLLKKNEFEDIVVVENGEDALNIARDEKFDLILMDMQMPIMNGFEATEKIRQIPEYKNIPIIALTAFAMKGDREKCLEAGATDYIPKPIDSKEFIDKVKYYTKKNN